MMGEHSSYHQSITGDEAERRLKMFGQNGYLTRYSKSLKCYVLTIYRKQRPDDVFEHLGIVIEKNGKHKIKGREDEEFGSIDALLAYYETHRISPGFPSIGKIYTEEEFDRQQDELDQKENATQEKEKQLLVNKLIEEFQEVEEQNRRELHAALEQKQRELHAADTRRQRELHAAEEQRLRDLQAAEAQRQRDLRAAEEMIQELRNRPQRELYTRCTIL